ncbi:hypothetical protein CMT41_14330 [Colwellia sp. MT41]|uniref:Uncharacterized protein n=1 Tax=Colwellia marinimaniae TaxID=1513592 RepID=A0ABQ0MX97_9GAMM|nr:MULTISPECIES: hypothetical protein [Colwellia]ALO35763.1 hypothetical protein CMT41_14330 [Colwellia sp. MT41]GAW96914.1 hypothetical protein MTCD1_02537 [Colwellia marinimaniae]
MSTESMPGYLAGANSDPLMIVMTIILVVGVLLAGVLYFKLHAVPEHLAHGKNHSQIQLITVLTILALFTHNNIFWVAALVLAVVEVPDFLAPLKSMAKSLEIIAKAKDGTAPQAPEQQAPEQKNSVEQVPGQQVINKENN